MVVRRGQQDELRGVRSHAPLAPRPCQTMIVFVGAGWRTEARNQRLRKSLWRNADGVFRGDRCQAATRGRQGQGAWLPWSAGASSAARYRQHEPEGHGDRGPAAAAASEGRRGADGVGVIAVIDAVVIGVGVLRVGA